MDKEHSVYDVFVGMFHNFPEGMVKYNYDWKGFNKFFFEKRTFYSILNELAFDTGGDFPESKELYLAEDTLDASWMVFWTEEDPFRNFIDRDAIKTSFDKCTKKKFNKFELNELERLSKDFQEEFC